MNHKYIVFFLLIDYRFKQLLLYNQLSVCSVLNLSAMIFLKQNYYSRQQYPLLYRYLPTILHYASMA
jgi:hypothetical protein